MTCSTNFVQKSLELHLFFARIMKEHAFFLAAGFVAKDQDLIQRALYFNKAFDGLLAEALALSFGVVSRKAVEAQEFVTANTVPAETVTQRLSGIPIDIPLTELERTLVGNGQPITPAIEARVRNLNARAMPLIADLIRFKAEVLARVLSCQIFTHNFPSLIEHVREEAELYLLQLTRLQQGITTEIREEALEEEIFWNHAMGDHALFIRNLLDPTEVELFKKSQAFAKEFSALAKKAEHTKPQRDELCELTEESLQAARAIRDFKFQATVLLIQCRIKSIIIPLLGDHVTREANHFLRRLKDFRRDIPCHHCRS